MSDGSSVRVRVLTAVASTGSSTTTFTGETGDGDVVAFALFTSGVGANTNPVYFSQAFAHVTGASAATVRGEGIGATDGASPDSYRSFSSSTDVAILIEGNGTVTDYAQFDERTTDGFRIEWNAGGSNPGAAYDMVALVIFADDSTDIAVDVGDDSFHATQNTAKTISLSTSFDEEPELILTMNSSGVYDESAINGLVSGLGFAHSTGGGTPTITQCGMCFLGLNAQDANGARRVSDEYAINYTLNGTISSAEITDTGTESFEVTTREANGARPFAYMAISFKGNIDSYVGLWDADSSTGDISNTSVGFMPAAYVLGLGLVNYTNRNSNQTGSPAHTQAVGLADDTNEACVGFLSQNATSGNEEHYNDMASVIQVYTHASSLTWDGTHSSMDSGGFTINVSDGLGSNSGVPVLAIELRFIGSGSGDAPLATGTGTGTLEFPGSGSGDAPLATGTGTGTLEFPGSGSGDAPLATGTGSGGQEFSGSGSGDAPLATGTGSGALEFSATGSGDAPLATGTGTGAVGFTGTASGDAPLATGTGSGTLEFPGSGSGDAPLATGTGTGGQEFSGSGSGDAPLGTGTGTGALEFIGTGSGDAPLPTGTGSGVVAEFVGSASGDAPLATGTGSGLLEFIGTGSGDAPLATGTGSGTVTVLVGCYELISNTIRARFATIATSVQIFYDNKDLDVLDAPLAEGADFWKLSVLHQLTEPVSRLRLRKRGVARAQYHALVGTGEAALHGQVDTAVLLFRGVTASGVVYGTPLAAPQGRQGHYWVWSIEVPWYYDETVGAEAAPGSWAKADYDDIGDQARDRFDTLVGTPNSLTVLYDNAPTEPPELVPSNDPAVWVRWTVLPGIQFISEATDGASGGNRYRTPGVAVAQLFQPIGTGDQASLELADTIAPLFRSVSDGKITWQTPRLETVGRSAGAWQANVVCPFYVEDYPS